MTTTKIKQDSETRWVTPESDVQVQKLPSVELRGMPIHAVTLLETVERIIADLDSGQGGWVVTPNLDILRRYAGSDAFRAVIASSTLAVADGMPLVWASRAKGTPLPERVNGTDLMCQLVEAVAERERSVYFLGGSPGTAKETATRLTKELPGLEVAGYYCPRYGFERELAELELIEDMLVDARPDIVFVGLGSPKQDVLINALRLRLPHVWWIGVGVSFSFICGDLPRAPDWARHSGLEWFYRLCAEPRRLAKRYLLTGLPFFAVTMLVSLLQRPFARRSGRRHR